MKNFTIMPFTVKHIDHIVFRVLDLNRSVEFYQALLGCEVVKQREDLGLIHLRAGTSMLDLVSIDGQLGRQGGAPAAVEGRNVDHICLRIEPFNEADLIQHLQKHNVQPLGKAEVRFGAEGDGLSIYFLDPDGNTIELKGPSD